jgi:hypothetical protein
MAPINPILGCFIAKTIEAEAEKVAKGERARQRELVLSAVDEYSGAEIPFVGKDEIRQSHSRLVAVDFGYGVSLEGVKTDQDTVVFFQRKPPREDTFRLRLKPLAEVKKALGLKSAATIEEVCGLLNTLTENNRLDIQTSPPYIVKKRGVDLTLEEGIFKMSKLESDGFWEELLNSLSEEVRFAKGDELKKKKKFIESLTNKLSQHLKGEDNEYFRLQDGRKSFTAESQQAFLEELEERNPEMAAKVTKEFSGEGAIKILGEFRLEDVESLSNDFLRFLEQHYSNGISERAKRESAYREEFSRAYNIKF